MERRDEIELAHRSGNGLEVWLRWQRGEDELTVEVADDRSGESFHLRVRGEKALDAFYHPFAYAA